MRAEHAHRGRSITTKGVQEAGLCAGSALDPASLRYERRVQVKNPPAPNSPSRGPFLRVFIKDYDIPPVYSTKSASSRRSVTDVRRLCGLSAF